MFLSFTATILGTPKQLKDDDIQCEYPVEADDEYVTERGFTPTLHGESTKLSSALALFKLCRILSKVLEELFPAKATYELSLKRLADLSEELDTWNSSLAPHLRLQFVQDKPSTNTVNSRSPILSLAYHYIRALIQRPVIGANLGSRSSSSVITMANSCKSMIQIVQLLIERGMSFSFCLNRDEVMVICSFGLLYQGMNLDSSSKILKDNSKLVNAIVTILAQSKAPCAVEFKRIARSFLPPLAIPVKESAPKQKTASLSRHSSDGIVAPPTIENSTSLSPASLARKNLKAIASRFTSNGSPKRTGLESSDHRRATVHNISLHPHGVASQSVPSLQPSGLSSSLYDPSTISRSEPARSPLEMFNRPSSNLARPLPTSQPKAIPIVRPTAPVMNLDYLSFGNEGELQLTGNCTTKPIKTEPEPTDWEKLIGSLDGGHGNIYDNYYGSSANDSLFDTPPLGMQHFNHSSHAVNEASWTSDLWALTQTNTNASAHSVHTASSGQADSIWSFSTDERDVNSNTTDDLASSWTNVNTAPPPAETYRGILMPELGHDGLGFGPGWETHTDI